MFQFLFSSLPRIASSFFLPPPAGCPACCSTAYPPGKEWSHQPMTPCWDMRHFCHYTSHLPKLACIITSYEQLNCVRGWQRRLGGRKTKMQSERVAPCGGRQVLPGWTGRAFEEAAAGGRAVTECKMGWESKKERLEGFRKTYDCDWGKGKREYRSISRPS